MSSVRQSYRPHAIPNLLICSDDTEVWLKLWAQEDDDKVKMYLEYVLQYRKMLDESFFKYELPGAAERMAEALLERINGLNSRLDPDRIEFVAAVSNLEGLVLRRLHRREAAIEAFSRSLKDDISDVTRVCLSHQMGVVYGEMGFKSYAEFYLAPVELGKINEDSADTETKHILAAVYNMFAYFNRKKFLDNPVIAEKYFDKALALWSENMFIANNAAILLSKISDPVKLEKAEALLSKFYDLALMRNEFVTLYYRADINIKLAAFHRGDKDKKKFNSYVAKADAYLMAAEKAASDNLDYSDNYKLKASARCKNLLTSLSRVRGGEIEICLTWRAATIDEREKVVEDAAVRDKFYEKLFDLRKPFSAYMLFRRPMMPVEVKALEPVASSLKITPK